MTDKLPTYVKFIGCAETFIFIWKCEDQGKISSIINEKAPLLYRNDSVYIILIATNTAIYPKQLSQLMKLHKLNIIKLL